MSINDLANELIYQIFRSCSSISSILALSATCHRFRHVFANSSQKLELLAHAADAEFGPLDEILQLLTYNDTQVVHLRRNAPMSLALLKQVLAVGRVAVEWEDIYPIKKWKSEFADRRLLSPEERRRLRRAVYRLWLFSRAFHNRNHSRETRLVKSNVLARAALLHNWPNAELAELADVHAVFRDVVANNICPSNGTVREKVRKRVPDGARSLFFGMYINYPPPSALELSNIESQFHSHIVHPTNTRSEVFRGGFDKGSNFRHCSNQAHSDRFWPSRAHDPAAEGWGDDISHYYVVEDIMKLSPPQILHLRQRCPLKSQVLAFVREVNANGGQDDLFNGLGERKEAGRDNVWSGFEGWHSIDWFDNNGETFMQTLELVMQQRDMPLGELMDDISDGVLGVATADS